MLRVAELVKRKLPCAIYKTFSAAYTVSLTIIFLFLVNNVYFTYLIIL